MVPIYARGVGSAAGGTAVRVTVYDGVVERTNSDIDDGGERTSRKDVLAMRGTGFDFTNDEIESLSDCDDEVMKAFEV